MLLHAYLPVNDQGVKAPAQTAERPYIDPVDGVVPVAGEDGAQSVSTLVFDCCLALVALAALIIWWPILQAVRL